jgi:hypothetical protein
LNAPSPPDVTVAAMIRLPYETPTRLSALTLLT